MDSSDQANELIETLCAYLDAGKFKEALELPQDNKYADSLKIYSWDIIPQLLKRIDDDTIIRWPALQRCCERLLLDVADRANAEEVLLELIEQTEIAKNDAQFIAVLLPLQSVLKRLVTKRGRSLEWCFNSIATYMETLPLPEDYDFSEEENLLMDCDANARRLLKIYSELPTFYDHFVKEAFKNQAKNPAAKNIILCFLIDLLGKPIALLDMTHGKTKSHCRVIVEHIFKDINYLQPNLFAFIQYVQMKCQRKRESLPMDGVYEDAPTDMFLLEEKLKPVSLGVLYYLLLVEKLPAPALPQVYQPVFIGQELLCLSVFLIQQPENVLCHKGLLLAQTLIALLPEESPSTLLTSVSPAVAKSLCNTAVYCPAEPLRKLAVVTIKSYIMKFDHDGRYLFLMNLLPTLTHSGIKGYIITVYKEAFMQAFQDGYDALYCFSGSHLRGILSGICHLPQGAETNLVESADQIISTLNLLRYLVLRDTENFTGIWNHVPHIQNIYLTPLRKGLELSRAHYEQRLLELDRGITEEDSANPISITVGNTPLDNLSPEKTKEVINAGINALHLTDSVLCRLIELINARNQA